MPSSRVAEYPRPDHILFHFSDTHLVGDGALYGAVDAVERLRELLAQAEASRITPAAIVFTGDLTDQGEPDAYDRLRTLVEPLAAQLGAHNVVYQLVYIVFQVAVGLSHGASILVSRTAAGEEYRRARTLAWLALRHAAVVAALVGVLYVVMPDIVLRPFLTSRDHATIHLAHTLLLIAIVLQFFDAAQNIGNGLLRGVTDTKAGFRLSLIGYWIVGLPTALLLAFPLRLGAAGVWWGLTAGLATTAALMLRRYFAHLDTREQAEPRLLADSLPGHG